MHCIFTTYTLIYGRLVMSSHQAETQKIYPSNDQRTELINLLSSLHLIDAFSY